MATSVYFNNFSAATINEQRLLEDLLTESIKIMGHDVYYLPRESWDGDDRIFGETRNAKFNRAYTMEMYMANVEGYEGDGEFFSKFGLEIRDTSNFVVSRRTFDRYMPSSIATRPREGDLIFVPIMNKIFEIKFVEEELLFFSLGRRQPYIYELRCEVFRYNNETLDTGMSEVDVIEDRVAYSQYYMMGNGSGAYHKNETVYQGPSIILSTASAEVKDWDPATKRLDIINIKGVFASGTPIIGATSNASFAIVSQDTLGRDSEYDLYDNKQLQDEANTFIDFSETNPFGIP